jgi:NADH-quinone oxidoreductase subunit F
MSAIDLSLLEPVLIEYGPRGRTALLPALHAAQAVYGWLPEPVADALGRALGVPLSEVYGVIDFYSMFYREPVGRTVVRICDDPACALAGSDALLAAACAHAGVSVNGTSSDGAYTVERVTCLGVCEHAPAALVNRQARGRVRADELDALFSDAGQAPGGIIGGDPSASPGQALRLLTRNCGRGHATTLPEYEASGGYAGLRRALQMPPDDLIAEIKASGLVGRGGAAFPTWLKWQGTRQAPGTTKYAIVNADESEPGTFKDRVLMEEDPHSVVEGFIIEAYAAGAARGYFYIRGEYPHAHDRVGAALDEARQAGYLGDNILGSGFSFDVELRLGAGAYICGEETALFESIEGKRGFPRVKPPFPTTFGVFGQPTAINNVETLLNVPYIVTHGAAAFRALGTEKSPGPKLFCLSGDVAQPGLYEVRFGTTLRQLLYEMGGGLPAGRRLQAVLFGGAAGAFATEQHLDLPLTFEDLRAAGLPLGSGVVMVFDDTRDLRDVLRRLARFFAHESCGKCYPCQIGTQRQHEILERVAAGQAAPGDARRLQDVGWTMTDASLCGLGQTAASAVLSAMQLWPHLFESEAASPSGPA